MVTVTATATGLTQQDSSRIEKIDEWVPVRSVSGLRIDWLRLSYLLARTRQRTNLDTVYDCGSSNVHATRHRH
jgi:hypothetical protein